MPPFIIFQCCQNFVLHEAFKFWTLLNTKPHTVMTVLLLNNFSIPVVPVNSDFPSKMQRTFSKEYGIQGSIMNLLCYFIHNTTILAEPSLSTGILFSKPLWIKKIMWLLKSGAWCYGIVIYLGAALRLCQAHCPHHVHFRRPP